MGATDAFMNAVKNNEDYDVIDPISKEVVGKKNARQLFDKLRVHGKTESQE